MLKGLGDIQFNATIGPRCNNACLLIELVFPLIFPDDCRVCGTALREVSRIPVCAQCLADPQPLVAEYFCAACRTPFTI